MRPLLAAALALVCAAAGATEVYKWVDKDGRVHYGDRPKTGGEAIEVRPASGPGEPPPTTDQAARDAECQRKKAQLAQYQKASTIKETDSLGRTREYSDAERQQLLAKTQQEIDAACAPATASAAAPQQ